LERPGEASVQFGGRRIGFSVIGSTFLKEFILEFYYRAIEGGNVERNERTKVCYRQGMDITGSEIGNGVTSQRRDASSLLSTPNLRFCPLAD